jgi:hypothetical protein
METDRASEFVRIQPKALGSMLLCFSRCARSVEGSVAEVHLRTIALRLVEQRWDPVHAASLRVGPWTGTRLFALLVLVVRATGKAVVGELGRWQ